MHLAGVICAAAWGGGCAGNILQGYSQETEENMSGVKCLSSSRGLMHL